MREGAISPQEFKRGQLRPGRPTAFSLAGMSARRDSAPRTRRHTHYLCVGEGCWSDFAVSRAVKNNIIIMHRYFRGHHELVNRLHCASCTSGQQVIIATVTRLISQ
jgi:hypothetical protein